MIEMIIRMKALLNFQVLKIMTEVKTQRKYSFFFLNILCQIIKESKVGDLSQG